MKKRRLKKWVVWTLKILFIVAAFIGVSDCENTKVFLISHIIAGIVILFSGYILIKNMEE